MTQQMSTALCNYLLGTGSLLTSFTNGSLIIYESTGLAPATADSPIVGGTHTELVRLTLPSGTGIGTLTAPSGGVISKKSTDTWTGTVSATGTALFYRLVGSNELNSSGGVTLGQDDTSAHACPRVQGTVGTGGADMNLGNVSLTSGAPFLLNYFTEAIVPS